MKLANLNIGKRLALGFGLMGVMLVLLIVLACTMIARVNASTDKIVTKRMPTIELTNRIDADTSIIAISLRNMMLNDDAEDRQLQIAMIKKASEGVNSNLRSLETALAGNPRSLGQLREMGPAADSYLESQLQLQALITSGQAEPARVYLNDVLRPRLAKLRAATAGQSKLQKELSTTDASDAAATYSNAVWLMCGIGALALLLGASVAW